MRHAYSNGVHTVRERIALAAAGLLTGDNAYRCDGCGGQRREATRTVSVCRAPLHLCVVLGRMEYDRATLRRRKILTDVHTCN